MYSYEFIVKSCYHPKLLIMLAIQNVHGHKESASKCLNIDKYLKKLISFSDYKCVHTIEIKISRKVLKQM